MRDLSRPVGWSQTSSVRDYFLSPRRPISRAHISRILNSFIFYAVRRASRSIISVWALLYC